MGQCFCTLCTLPIFCVTTPVVNQIENRNNRLIPTGLFFVSIGSTCFGFLTYFCGGLNFYGGTPCWSEGNPQYTWLGILSAFGLGIGFSILFTVLIKSLSKYFVTTNETSNPA